MPPQKSNITVVSPAHLKNIPAFRGFKQKLGQFLSVKCYLSLEAYLMPYLHSFNIRYVPEIELIQKWIIWYYIMFCYNYVS